MSGASTAISIGVAVASAAAGMAAAAAQAAGQEALAKQQQARNVLQQQFTEQNRVNQMAQAQQNITYKNDEAFQQLENMARNARAAKATALTSAGENGVDGVSIGALAQQYDARAGEFDSDATYNREADTREIQLQESGFNTAAQSAANQLRPPVFPSMLNTGLQIAGAGLNAYGKYINPMLRANPGSDTPSSGSNGV
jgi:hypothetical protein